MSHQSLYRKYRSQTFGDLIGQDHVVKTIQNGISFGRISHAYLFTGPRGTGKTSTARLLAKALCCESGPTPEPDNTCEICRSITAGSCVDVVEMDAASESGVDDIREQIVEVSEYRPMICRYKIFIIDEVHDLSSKAFDALLKTVEEPPPHIVFILATTEYNKVPSTIRSRCQKYEFHRASLQELVGRLSYVAEQEGVRAEPAAITAIARMADGGYRDGLTLLEQAMLTSESGEITLQQVYDQLGLVSEEVIDGLLIAMQASDVPKIMSILGDIARLGRDPRAIIESAMYRLADLTRASYQVSSEMADAAREASLYELATRLGRDFILRMRGDLAEAHKVIRDISLPRLWLESELVRLSLPRPVAPARAAEPRPAPTAPRPVRPAPAPTEPLRPSQEPRGSATAGQAAVPDSTNEASTAAKTLTASAPAAHSDEWQAIMAEIAAISDNLSKKLARTRLVRESDQKVLIEFPRELELEWIQSKKGAAAAVIDAVRKVLGAGFEVRLAAVRAIRVSEEPDTVELPAEGARLEQLAREVFGA